MLNSLSKQAGWLAYLGVIPFWIGAFATIWGFQPDRSLWALLTYGAIIAAFISGTHWGICIKDKTHNMTWIMVLSNLTTLLAWGSVLLANATNSLLLILLTLFILVYVDNLFYRRKQIEEWYIKLRWRVTLLVSASLVVTILNLQ